MSTTQTSSDDTGTDAATPGPQFLSLLGDADAAPSCCGGSCSIG
ncbi:hypothetical protein [Microbacterium ginsengisoli]|nr:hypothetical protein [Microbacterium ginsengisoli]